MGLERNGLEFKIHPRDKGFVLWATEALKRKQNRDFLTVYIQEENILVWPKFYGLAWKSDEAKHFQRKLTATEIPEEYLSIIIQAYKSIVNEDSGLFQNYIKEHIPAVKQNSRLNASQENTYKARFNQLGEALEQPQLKVFPTMMQTDPEYVITQARSITEKVLKQYYLKATGNAVKDNLIELINNLERENLISPRVINLIHTVRKAGNYTIHDGRDKSWLKEEAALIIQAVQIILGEIVEKQQSLNTLKY